MNDRLENGVRRRMDGGGDDWAAAHRKSGFRSCYMMDLDSFAGFMTFEKNSEDKMFVEYTVDGEDVKTDYGFVAFFDRKRVPWARACTENVFRGSRLMQLGLCRKIQQAIPPRFFYVCGARLNGPWTLGEWDIVTGEALQTWELTLLNFRQVWIDSGLMAHRSAIQRLTGVRR